MANIQSEIKDLQEAINSPATPEAQKVVMRGILAKLQSKVGKVQPTITKTPGFINVDFTKMQKAPTKKAQPKKKASKPEEEFDELDKKVYPYLFKKYPRYTDELLIKDNDNEELSDDEYNNAFLELVDDIREQFDELNDEKGGNSGIANDMVESYMSYPEKYAQLNKSSTKAKATTLGDYNCDELIEKEKAKAKKRKANALKKANEPKKTDATKNKERIERVADVVETNLEKRLAKNEVSVEEIRKLIDETESLLTKLKEALKKAR